MKGTLFIKGYVPYFLKMLLMAVAAPACLILLGSLVMSVVEPKPEFGGYVHEWSRDIRSIIFILSLGIALKCAAFQMQEHRRRQKNRALASSPGLATTALRCFLVAQVLSILIVIPVATTVACSFFIYEQTMGACDSGL